METAIYVAVALVAGYVVGKLTTSPRTVLQVVVQADAPSSELGITYVSKDRADTILWTMNGNESFNGVPAFGAPTPPDSPRPYLNPVKISPTQIDSKSLNSAVRRNDSTPYTLPGSNRTYNGRIIIQK
jgi:hypothetical protein